MQNLGGRAPFSRSTETTKDLRVAFDSMSDEQPVNNDANQGDDPMNEGNDEGNANNDNNNESNDNNESNEPAAAPEPAPPVRSEREQVLDEYRAKIREHREVEARLKRLREDVKGLSARYQKTEDDLKKALTRSKAGSAKQISSDVKKSSGPSIGIGS